MPPSPRLLAAALALALPACSVAEDTRVNVVFADNGPNARDTGMAAHRALAEDIGLVVFDANGQVSPALAQRWVVADDGLSYIFRIDDLVWPNGDTVTARQIVVMLNEAIARARVSVAHVGDVIVGHALTAGGVPNPARPASMKAGVA